MLRTLAVAAAISALAISAASADTWTSANSTMTFTVPSGWTAQQQNVEGMTYVLATAGDEECHVIAFLKPDTAEVTPDRIRAAGQQPIPQEALAGVPASLTSVFYNGDGQLTGSSVDSHPFWPIQRAEYQSNGRPVHGAIQFRPGSEFWTFCYARSGADNVATYDTIIRSVASTNDTELQADAERLERRAAQRADMNNQSHRSSLGEDNTVFIEQRTAAGMGGN